MKHVDSNAKDKFLISHGPAWHIEKPGTSGCQCYTIVGNSIVKDLESAKKLVELFKACAKEQLEYEEEGALRMTVFEPLPVKDSEHYLVLNSASFKDSAFHIAHKDRKDPSRDIFMKPMMGMFQDGSIIMKTDYFEAGMCEFANSVHYERP